RPSRRTIWPYTTLFRSRAEPRAGRGAGLDDRSAKDRVPMNDTAVIVVSYNTRDLTLQAVASARKATDGLDARVIVADNDHGGVVDRKSTRLNSSHGSSS